MGRRSINTTKSGKFMNPTDQARKEARKRELKKNKKQRMAVRMAVLKGKDPQQLLEEMEMIDKQEFDPTQPPRLNERVLKDKRKKLRETFDRVIHMYDKEEPQMAMELRKMSIEYEHKRMQLQVYYEQVKNAERVRLEQIPLPEAPSNQAVASMLPLPGDIPLPQSMHRPVHGILKKSQLAFDKSRLHAGLASGTVLPTRKRKPPGPPPGPPPPLSDSEDDLQHADDDEAYDPERDIEETDLPMDVDLPASFAQTDSDATHLDKPPAAKQRKIRFEDDATHDPDAEEKDTRLRYKMASGSLTALQTKMLQLAGQPVPAGGTTAGQTQHSKDDSDNESSSSSEDEDEDGEHRAPGDDDRSSSDDEDDTRRPNKSNTGQHTNVTDQSESQLSQSDVGSLPAGPPPVLPPGPPPGLPPMMMRPPPLRGAPPGMTPRMLPPGPPRGRPPGLPPIPPLGMPPNIRAGPPPLRMPPGPPGIPPPRLVGPPGIPPNVPPPALQPIPSSTAAANPGVLSAPPSIMKLPQRTAQISGEDDSRRVGVGASSATIEAKPQIRHMVGDVTRFTPTALRVKREMKDAKGQIVKPAATVGPSAGKAEEPAQLKTKPTVPVQTKDDAYDTFMKEMAGLL